MKHGLDDLRSDYIEFINNRNGLNNFLEDTKDSLETYFSNLEQSDNEETELFNALLERCNEGVSLLEGLIHEFSEYHTALAKDYAAYIKPFVEEEDARELAREKAHQQEQDELERELEEQEDEE